MSGAVQSSHSLMNPISADPTAPPPPPQPQPPRSSFSCDRHPDEHFNGFCPSCLCERLTTLDHSSSNTPSSSRRPSSASAAIKSLFSKPNHLPPPPPLPKPSNSNPTSFFPELRRTKSFSASKNEALGLSFEPQRKSCDVRVRNTLSTLFSLDGDSSSHSKPTSSSHQNSKKIESFKNGEDFIEAQNVEGGIGLVDDEADEIRPVQDSHLEGLRKSVELSLTSGEIAEQGLFSVSNLKPMKDHVDLNSQGKKSSGGKIWAAASVFSKKWQKWRTKQKAKKQTNGENLPTLPVEKPVSRQFRDTQSEIADYGYGRRSCDTDPRFSLDAGRISFDDARYSFEEPRASWDGYLIGKTFPRMAPMLSVMEDAPSSAVSRSDMQIPVEEPTRIRGTGEEEGVPGGSIQTKEYYLDSSSSRRRKSLDRSSSIKKTAAAVVAEINELKNPRVSPSSVDSFHRQKLLVDSNPSSLRDDLSETFELSSGLRDINPVIGNGNEGEERKEAKKSKRWKWRIWGFIHRRGGSKDDEEEDEEEEKYSRVNGVERSLSETWRGGLNRTMLRSNSSVSWRNGGNQIGAPFASGRRSCVEMYGHGKKRNEFVLEKNRSARYSESPNHFDNGLLRFYLTPMRGSRRGGGLGKVKPTNSNPIARSVLRLY